MLNTAIRCEVDTATRHSTFSLRLLEGEFKAGDKIKVTANGDELVFQKK